MGVGVAACIESATPKMDLRARGSVELATDVKSVWVGVEMRGIVVYPGDRAADLIGKHHEAAADILHPGEVGHDIMRTGGEEHLGWSSEILRAAAAPAATVDKHEDRCRGAFGAATRCSVCALHKPTSSPLTRACRGQHRRCESRSALARR